MTAETTITHGGTDRRYKLCKCSVCGRVERCTPSNDFYTLGKSNLGPLYCDGCFKNVIHK